MAEALMVGVNETPICSEPAIVTERWVACSIALMICGL
jgi:hypothetical protein